MMPLKSETSMTIQAILFDLDNTLTHRDLSVQQYSQSLVRHYAEQLQNPTQACERVIDLIRYIDNGGYPLKERLTQPSIAASVADALIQQLDWMKAPSLDELTAYWFSQFGLNAVAMPYAEQVLQQLKQQSYRLAVVSNGGHATRETILKGLGFQQYFDVVVSSELAGVAKPQQGIFQYACRQLNVLPEHCLFVGDHPVNDIQGAVDVGMQAVWLSGFHADEPKVTHTPIQQLTELFTLLTSSEVECDA